MKFEHSRNGSSALWVAEEFAVPIAGLGWPRPGALADAQVAGAVGTKGRGEPRILELPGHRTRLHLRPLRHGGWLRAVFGDRWLSTARGHHELQVTAQLGNLGAPVPIPILLLCERYGPFFRAAVGTAYVEDAVDVSEFLAGCPTHGRMLQAARAAGGAVRRFHDAGGRHTDLHAANLLLREDASGSDVLVIDLDRARAGSAPSASRRMRELMRIYRSLLKRDLLGVAGPRTRVAFFAAYVGRDRALRRAMLARLPHERRRIAIHTLGYR